MVNLGFGALAAALITSLCGIFYPLMNVNRNPMRAFTYARRFSILQFIFLLSAFLILVYKYAISDFSLLNVALNSHSQLSSFYKIAGAWSNHEGSMLLWILILSLYGVLAGSFTKSTSDSFMALALVIQGIIVVSFIVFVIFLANPFLLLAVPAAEGQGLNPILHDPSLGFHPPLLYFGYLGFSLCFSFAIAGLLIKKIDKEWASCLRPWVLLSWSFLTLGITLGSWWAYYELGWGGYWFWDPVENASMMPWLIGVALIHSLMTLEKRGNLALWSAFLAILIFSLCLLGSFLVRSGVVSSVHSFAYDPGRGTFIFSLIVLAFGGGLLLLMSRGRSLISEQPLVRFSLDWIVLIQVMIFLLLTFIIFVGSVFPIFYEMISEGKISVGPVYYNSLTLPIFSLVLIMMHMGPSLINENKGIKHILKPLMIPFIVAFIIICFTIFYYKQSITVQTLTLFLAFNLLSGLIIQWWQSRNTNEVLPRSFYRMAVAHGGVALMIFGMSIDSLSKQELIGTIGEGEHLTVSSYTIKLSDVVYTKEQLYLLEKANLYLSKDGKQLGTLHPEKRIYLSDNSITTEVALFHDYFSDLYVVLGQQLGEDRWAFKLSYHPQILWIWLGGLLLALGGLLGIRSASAKQV
jgi:cytochrome c-type biogenesis protein CcmF